VPEADRDEVLDDLYGASAPLVPADAARLLQGYPGRWWIAGGWAIEAFSGVRRPHHDLDVGVLGGDLPALRRHLAGRLHVWTATDGALAPLLPDDRPDGTAEEVLPRGCGNLWTRRSARDPWEVDFLLGPGTAQEWIYRRDPALRMPMAAALWQQDGIDHLQPEIQLLYKSAAPRPQDQRDLEAVLPLLDDRRRRWLRDALERTTPGHRWADVLR
jgi:hypothetical protein